jgi:two-component sensor histidine kinase
MYDDGPDQVVMEIGDNGKGFVASEQIEKSPTLGLQLIRLLAQQLDASLELDSTVGTKYKLVINMAENSSLKESA